MNADDMTGDDEGVLARLARRLARLRRVSTGVLARTVTDGGTCMEVSTDDGPPRWLHHAKSDRELAARLCAGCPVQSKCLALELRTFGEQTVGVWGALGEDDRRALIPDWRRLTAEPCPPGSEAVGGPQHQPGEPGRGEL
jgi:WhiB family transcriptional regulator, redox-sensing transcriptional regulator